MSVSVRVRGDENIHADMFPCIQVEFSREVHNGERYASTQKHGKGSKVTCYCVHSLYDKLKGMS